MTSRSNLLRKINERKILNIIRQKETVSRADLARELKLTLPTVSRIVDELLQRNWLLTVGTGNSSGGRPPTLVRMNPMGAGVIGVELGRETIRIVYTDLLARIIYAEEQSVSKLKDTDDLVDELQEFIRTNHIIREHLLGIGIASPNGPFDHWFEPSIKKNVEARLGVKVDPVNDSNAAALAENWFGHGRRFKNTLFVLQDVGIGSGIVLDGSIWRGTRNMAGEISHTVVNMEGEKCGCGKRGCVDTYASMIEIERKVEKHRKRDPDESFSVIIKRAKEKKDPDYSVIQKTARYVAMGIFNVMETIDMKAVILGGSMLLLEDAYLAKLVQSEIHKLSNNRWNIYITSFDINAVCIGAATLILQQIYDHTQLIQ